MTVGTVLKQAREQAGLSAGQISEHTKIQLYKIKALEEDDFSRLPEGIYLDGIVRAYSREVGLNPEAMVARARIERGKRPATGKCRSRRRLISAVRRVRAMLGARRSRTRQSDRFIRDRAPNAGCAGGNRSRSWSTHGQSADRAPPQRSDSPAIALAPTPRPEDRRGRFVLALLALFAAAFQGRTSTNRIECRAE